MRRFARILAWLGLAASLAAVAAGLVYYGDLMRPFWKGTAAQFWSGVAGVPVAEGEKRYGQPPPLAGFPHRYFYDANPQGTLPLHGQHFKEVPEAEVLAAFPDVIGRLIADPTELHPDQVRALVGANAVSKDAGLKRLESDRAAIGGSLERMREFLRVSYKVRLSRAVAEFGPAMTQRQAEEAGWLGGWVDRAGRYWANIVFEAVFLGGVVVLFWLPLLWSEARRRMAWVWGSLPILLFLPYWLGYCRAVFCWPYSRFWGGALYP